MTTRSSYLVLTLIAMGVVAALGVWRLTAQGDDMTRVSDAPVLVESSPPVNRELPPAAAIAVSTSTTATVAPADVTRWSEDAVGGDASLRATAITGLAQAPTAQALPILRRVLLSGEPAVDRPLALASIRELALDRGDADGAIRAVVREAIYHADDSSNVEATQDVLDVIEESEMK